MNEFLKTVERIRVKQQERAAAIATLPCGECTIGSSTANGCSSYGWIGCKHQGDLERQREEAESATAEARKAQQDADEARRAALAERAQLAREKNPCRSVCE